MQQQNAGKRFIFLVPAMVALVAAVWGGLLKLGWALPAIVPPAIPGHGPLMISGFLGTVIGIERAVALGRRWTYIGPVLTGIGGLSLILGGEGLLPVALMTLGSLCLVVVFGFLLKAETTLHTAVMSAAAVIWFTGNTLWLLGASLPSFLPFWLGFLILTIAGERLELSRLLFLSGTVRALFLATAALFTLGLMIAAGGLIDLGWQVMGAGMLAMAAWLLKFDIARRTVKMEGLTRFIALCLLSGYAWLGYAGLLSLIYGFEPGGMYDVILHSVFLGFVFAMIFGHAPVIFPAVLGVQMEFSKRFYIHLSLLHLSLLIRVAGGLMEYAPLRQWGGMLNGITLLLFIANTVLAVRAGTAAAARARARVPSARPTL